MRSMPKHCSETALHKEYGSLGVKQHINRQDEAEKWQALARQELEAFDSWPLVTRLKDLGLTIRERKMADGGRLIIAVDDLARFSGHVDGFQYRECFAVRLGPNGERSGRDGDINAPEWYKRWYSTGAGIEGYVADDIKRAARGK